MIGLTNIRAVENNVIEHALPPSEVVRSISALLITEVAC